MHLPLRSRPPLQECSRAPGRKVPPEVLFERFWAPGSDSPREWQFSGLKMRHSALKKHSLGHSEPGAHKCSKSTPGGTFRPGALEHSCKWRPGSQTYQDDSRKGPCDTISTKCTVSRRWFAVKVCDSFTRSNCTQRFFLGNRLRFLCGSNTVAVAMHFAMKNGQICFSLRNFFCDFACDSKNRYRLRLRCRGALRISTFPRKSGKAPALEPPPPPGVASLKRGLVAQCSATPATVPATPPCSATPFQTQISVRHLPGMEGGEVRHQN